MQTARDAPLAYRREEYFGLSIEKIIAGVMALLIAVPSPISVSLSLGGIVGLALAPVTFPVVWRNTRGRWLLVSTLALLPVGWFVAQTSMLQDRGRTFSTQTFLFQFAAPIGLLACVVGAYWCLTVLGLQRFLLLSFTGLLAAELTDLHPVNPWKYGLALPISMLAILLIARTRLLLGLVVTPLLIAVSLATNYRSWTVFLATAAIVVIFTRHRWSTPSLSRVALQSLVISTIIAVVSVLLFLATTAGMLGADLQQRTNRQLASNSNLLLTVRPDWGAGLALFRAQPLGLGMGISPSSDDYWLAFRNSPFTARRLNEVSDQFFHGGIIDFHSALWSLWGVYGLAGVVVAVLALIYFLVSILDMSTTELTQPNVRATVVLLMSVSIWDILFSPIVVAQLGIALAVAVHILRDNTRRTNSKEKLQT